ncbi:MAG: hypothetical protein Q8M29_03450 [Bacteroidota bacterium]|nr:hypothetical protein [Bacteroidota bacterium]
MRKIILPIFILSSNLFFAQVDPDRISISSDLIYTQKLYNNSFYDQLSRTNILTFNTPSRYIGIQQSGTNRFEKGKEKYGSFALSVSQMIPADITLNDTLKAKLTGCNFGIPLFGYDLFKNQKNIDLIIMTGVNTGRLRIYDNKLVRSKNGYFSPKGTLLLRITIKKIVLSFLGEYDRDISAGKWKKLKYGSENTINPNSFYQSAYSFSIGLGYRLNTDM